MTNSVISHTLNLMGEENVSGLIPTMIVGLVLSVLSVIALWKVYVKAGQPGWAAIIPFYNLYILLKIAGKPGWWLVFYFIPIINFVISIIVGVALAKTFNKSAVFGIFLLGLFSFIGYLILGFGKAAYVGAASMPQQPAPQPQSQ